MVPISLYPMFRKTAFLLLILTGIIPFACCPELPTGPYKIELSHLSPIKSDYMRSSSLSSASFFLKSDEMYQGDTLLLGLGLLYLLAHQPVAVSLYALAIATSCDDYPGYTHLQDKITSLEVYSDQPFHEKPAGEPLTDKVSVYNGRSKQFLSLPQAITNTNTLPFYQGMDTGLESLVLPGRPAELAVRTFTVRIAYKSGREQTLTSIPVRW